MEIKDLKKLLQEPYSTENWRVLLKDVFQNVDFLQTPTVIPTGDSRVKELRQYGTVRLSDGKNLALFELKLNDKVNLIGNRVGLNELVKKHIDQYRHHGILSIFEQGKEDYRFTFTAKNTVFDEEEGFIDKFTDTKRFTYILGANESCRTPAERFYTLSKIHYKTIEQVEDAFNVEKLSKKFFKEYIAQFDHLVHYLLNKPTYFQGVFNGKESDTRNYVKRFMGRLVFLKFIQKKGWLGVPVTESGWENGNFQFLEDQFKQFKNKEVFVSQFLNPLFYEALDVGNRPNDEFQNRGYKIPYLSGGLFDNDYKNDNRVDFPEESLTSLFDFFEMYNFTIDENDLHDKEVGIDPEMLGHIFENLLEDNKDKGAFYTPKEIVRYMCQESLKEYLKTHLEKQKLWPENPEKITETTESIANFVERKETSAILKFDKEFAIALKDVKICDPAIGSGAFPMGLLNEIFTMMKNLHEVSPDIVGKIWGMEKNKWQPNIIKENIIRNSIYGVDIEAGAVDIARLRFWLSLVLEEQEPKPLPHLDYKIVVGNSLVSKLGDTIIDIDWEADVKTQELFASSFIENQKNILNKITDKQIKAFDPNSDDEILSYEIKNLKIDLLMNQLQLLVENKGTQTVPSPTDRKFKELTALWLDTQGWKKQIKELEKLKQNKTADLEFFDWRLDFAEVMNPRINENPGFDIVIGNPPYDVYEGTEKKKLIAPLLSFEIYQKCKGGKINAYELFLAKIATLQKKNGLIMQIFQNSFLADSASKNLRKYFLEEEHILKIDSFPERDNKNTRVFESAKISVCILLSKSEKNLNLPFHFLVHKDKSLKNLTRTKFTTNEILIFNQKQANIPNLLESDKNLFIKYYNFDANIKYDTNYQCLEDELNMTFHKIFMSSDKSLPLIVKGAQVQRYHVSDRPSQGEIEFVLKKEYLKSVSTSQKSKHHNFKRIAMQGITGANDKIRIVATLIDKDIFCANSCNYIIAKDPQGNSIEFLLGIFNSRLTNWIFRKTSTNSNVNCYEVNDLMLPKKISTILKDKIINCVKSIYINNKKNTANEQQIDNLVYKLYNLTFEEAVIVEPELEERLSKEDYEAIEI